MGQVAAEIGVQAYANGECSRRERMKGLIVARDPAGFRLRVCGTSVLARAAVALGRHADEVYVWGGPGWQPQDREELQAELRQREHPPTVRWVNDPGAVPNENALVVVEGPVVFEPALIEELERQAGGAHSLVRCLARGNRQASLWYAGAQVAPQLKAWFAAEGAGFPERTQLLEYQPQETVCRAIDGERTAREAEQRLLARSGKEMDTLVARHFDRRISSAVTRLALRYPVTPNQLTVANCLVGILGALLLATTSWSAQVTGAGLLVLTVILDGSDGELARLKLMESSFGRKLDFFLDNVVNALAIFCVGVGASRRLGDPFWAWAGGFSTLCALACVWPVYVLFFLPGSTARKSQGGWLDPAKVAETVNGRDFVYIILFLALVDRIHWFVLGALVGLPCFLIIVLYLYVRRSRTVRSGEPEHSPA